MINLLPPEVKQDYAYALRNTVLRRWIVACIFGLVGLGFIATYGLATLQHSTTTYHDKVVATQTALTSQKINQTEAQVKDITGNLKLVVKVLSKEVLFSKLLKQIATVTPSKAILNNLQINQTTGAIDITAAATDYATATQVQVNLQDPKNQIFSKADIVSISCLTNAPDPNYPCVAHIRALFGSTNPYLFINNKDS